MDALWSQIGITWPQVLGVALAAVVLYAVYAAILRTWGHRLLASSSTLSLAAATVMGAIVARAMLGNAPTLLGGLVAIVTLVTLEGFFGEVRRRTRWPARRRHGATVIVIEGRILPDGLRAARLSERDLSVRLRQAGVLSIADLGLVVLEPRGALTVVPAGRTIDARLLTGVLGAGSIPPSLISDT